MEEQAIHDELTGIYNAEYLREILDIEVNRATRAEGAFSLMLVDIDGFAAVNEAHGADVGDDVLLHLVDVMQEVLRASDMLFRAGADEFAAILPETAKGDAGQPAQNLLEAVRATDWADAFPDVGELAVTVSIGLAGFPGDGVDAETMLGAARSAVKRAKESGRDAYAPAG